MKKIALSIFLLCSFCFSVGAEEEISCKLIKNYRKASIQICKITVEDKILTCIYFETGGSYGNAGGPSCNWEKYNSQKNPKARRN